jgi:GntR family transcriptional regulator
LNILAGKIRVDFRSSEPLYLQIARQIEQLVAQGELKLGVQLPTVRELATELRINFNTVSRAYKVLDDARIISTQRGRGTYIWEQPSAELLQDLRHRSLEELTHAYLASAVRLQFSPQEVVRTVQQQIKRWESGQVPESSEILGDSADE